MAWLPRLYTALAQCALLAGALASTSGHAQQQSQSAVPEGALLVVKSERQEYTLGESVVLRVSLFNAGTLPFTASLGGDSRMATRATRFKVTAQSDTGLIAEDPDLDGSHWGGMGSRPTLVPGQHCEQYLLLSRYCRIAQAPGSAAGPADFGSLQGDAYLEPLLQLAERQDERALTRLRLV